MSAVAFTERARERAIDLLRQQAIDRIWRRDPSLWVADVGAGELAARIANRLGWLVLPAEMRRHIQPLQEFTEGLRRDGFRDVYLLGMGGSSLSAEVLRNVAGVKSGYLDVRLVDTTAPTLIRSIGRNLPLRHSLFLVSSKSGTTVEVSSLERYYFDLMRREQGTVAGRHFCAITDPDTPLFRLAADRAYHDVFVNPPDVGGRYSALSLFGLVPAALMGIDLAQLLATADTMAAACRSAGLENPGLALGTFMGAAAIEGRDKLTVLLPPSMASLGSWIEQLVAESTGKDGKGLLPIVDEPADASSYGADRLFVTVQTDERERSSGLPHELERRGHPVFRIETSREALGGEFFRWQFAVAVACALLGVNPFDEPNVQESKDRTAALLATYAASGELPKVAPGGAAEGIIAYGSTGGRSPADCLAELLATVERTDYVALLSYLPLEAGVGQALEEIRSLIRRRWRVPTVVNVGPRYLHSTGQYFKGGPARGVFLLLTADELDDVSIPDAPYSFGVLRQAQAVGDFMALQARKRRVLRLHLDADPQRCELGLRQLFRTALR